MNFIFQLEHLDLGHQYIRIKQEVVTGSQCLCGIRQFQLMIGKIPLNGRPEGLVNTLGSANTYFNSLSQIFK